MADNATCTRSHQQRLKNPTFSTIHDYGTPAVGPIYDHVPPLVLFLNWRTCEASHGDLLLRHGRWALSLWDEGPDVGQLTALGFRRAPYHAGARAPSSDHAAVDEE